MTKSTGVGRHPPSRRTHGHSFVNGKATPEYNAWASMKERCLSPRCHNYRLYGERGITICPQWIQSFEAFLSDMGTRPSSLHSLDRINNDGNYEPENCRWATAKEQRRNQRRTRLIEFRGKQYIPADLPAVTGLSLATIKRRINAGRTLERGFK